MGARGPSPAPSCPRTVCARCWGGGSPSSSWALSPGGIPGWCDRGFPPVPLMRAVGACYWVGGPPPPSPPWQPLALGAGSRSGGGLGSVRPPSGSRALRARWEPPSGSCSPPHGVVLRCCARGSPPDPSLRAMSTRCWLGVPLPPSSPRRMLALGARDRSGGGALLRLSVVQLPLRARPPGVFIPPLLLLVSRYVWCGPMAFLLWLRNRTGLVTHQHLRRRLVILTARVHAVFSRSASCARGVFGRVPYAAGSH